MNFLQGILIAAAVLGVCSLAVLIIRWRSTAQDPYDMEFGDGPYDMLSKQDFERIKWSKSARRFVEAPPQDPYEEEMN